MRIANYWNNTPGSYDEIVTPAYDLTGLPAGGQAQLKFQLAYSGKAIPASTLTAADTAYDALRVFVSTDCGGTWVQKYSKSGTSLTTCSPVTGSYVPASTSDWRKEIVILPGMLTQDNVRLKFQFHSNGANNLYVDDINITCSNYGINENLLSDIAFSIQPNPVNDNSVISFNLGKNDNVKLSICNLLGQEVMTLANGALAAGEHKYTISHNDFGDPGFYFVKISINGQTMTKKVIVN
jgi:hypothetical protein